MLRPTLYISHGVSYGLLFSICGFSVISKGLWAFGGLAIWPLPPLVELAEKTTWKACQRDGTDGARMGLGGRCLPSLCWLWLLRGR